MEKTVAETRRMTCVVCPRGCSLEIEIDDRAGGPVVLALWGNACRRGDEYGRGEAIDPRRSLTSTVRTQGLSRRRLPVRSSSDLPLGRLAEAARELDSVLVTAPVAQGDVIVANILGLGADIVASDDLVD
jgi:CxxC motif-containing protein